MFKLLVISIALLLSETLAGQAPRLSRYELRWAIVHPLAALQVKRMSRHCSPVYTAARSSAALDTFSTGGRYDAYRHAFYMACFAQRVQVKKLRRLGKAHERANYRDFLKHRTENGEPPDSLSSVMDLLNNELGFSIAAVNRRANVETISQLVIQAIAEGKAVVLKRNAAGEYLRCNGQKIDRNCSGKQWHVPKCLVASNSN